MYENRLGLYSDMVTTAGREQSWFLTVQIGCTKTVTKTLVPAHNGFRLYFDTPVQKGFFVSFHLKTRLYREFMSIDVLLKRSSRVCDIITLELISKICKEH
jgi:hypothetical protein